MNRTETFEQLRPLLFSIAYRMLGTVMEAEDTVQEAFLRWQRVDPRGVDSPKAYLAAVVTRLCIDHLRAARVRRESYVGPWLPEPLLAQPPLVHPEAGEAGVEQLADSLSVAFLLLLERLTPAERAAFLLREVFEYDYPEIAHVLDRSEAACRQLVRRARQHVAAGRSRFDATPQEAERLLSGFAQSLSTGDMPGLLSILSDDITLWADGGGKARAARNVVQGASNVARFVMGVFLKAPPGFVTRLATINGQPGAIGYVDEMPYTVALFDVGEGRIQRIYLVVNPDKLQNLPALDSLS
jgi:RNA polymerase sigma-70 factor, ECF subfamily